MRFLLLCLALFASANSTPKKIHLGKMLAKIKTRGCAPLPAKNWVSVLLMGQAVTHSLKFNEACDLEGTVTLTRTPFPVDLAVRNVPNVSRVKAVLEFVVSPRLAEKELDISLQATEGRCLGRREETEAAAFSAIFSSTLGLDGKRRGPISADYHVTRYHGKTADFHEKAFY